MSKPRDMAVCPTVGSSLADAVMLLAGAGIEEPRREARLLLASALSVDTASILGHPDRLLERSEHARFAALLGRRAAHEPTARVLGRREFWSLDFALTPETLVPRPDSETVVEAALANISNRRAALRILDFGTGTGCLLLALLSELPASTGVGIDFAPKAALAARRNAAALGLAGRSQFVAGSWGTAIAGRFDVIVANPPYIASGAIAGLAPEVARYDPTIALDGGTDGLDSYRALAPDVVRLLGDNGLAVVELGAGQAESAGAILRWAGLAIAAICNDLEGIERCLVLRRRSGPPGDLATEAKKTVGNRAFHV
jgi:release factor glutamine methyltransferase